MQAISRAYYDCMEKSGHRDWLLYGPCHAIGLMEGEPQIESNSDYPPRENMTYCVDIFMGDNVSTRDFRIEDSVRVGNGRADSMTDYPCEIFRTRRRLRESQQFSQNFAKDLTGYAGVVLDECTSTACASDRNKPVEHFGYKTSG